MYAAFRRSVSVLCVWMCVRVCACGYVAVGRGAALEAARETARSRARRGGAVRRAAAEGHSRSDVG